MKRIFALLSLASLVLLSSCGEDTFVKQGTVKVILQRGSDYQAENPIQYVRKGESAHFSVTISDNSALAYVSYPDHEIVNQDDTHLQLTLKNIQYPTSVSLYVSRDAIYYYANGGTRIGGELDYYVSPRHAYHLKENSLNAYDYFQRDGYLPVSWNTSPDGTGTDIPFGSRLPYYEKEFYLQWKKECTADEFEFSQEGRNVTITKYLGKESEVVIPQYIQEKKVTKIASYAFQDENLETVYLPRGINILERRAFYRTAVKEIYFCDDIVSIGSNVFSSTIEKVHINAVVAPRMSGTYYDTFPDKMDYLDMVKDEKKIVLFSGSSTRYGYSSPLMDEAFPGYKTVNMGVFAYVNVRPQIDIISAFLKEGDLFVSSPEFDVNSLECQCGTTDAFEWNMFNFVESDYNLLRFIDVRDYPNFFDSFTEFQMHRDQMVERGYGILPKHYDDDENSYIEDTYNIQGDFILPREGNPTDSWIMQPLVNYTRKTITEERVQSLNRMYQKLLDLGVDVYFTFSPKNRRAIDSDSTSYAIKEAEKYLRDHLVVPVISTWLESILPGTSFYLIDNHLSSEAAIERTRNVIGHLREYRKEETDKEKADT